MKQETMRILKQAQTIKQATENLRIFLALECEHYDARQKQEKINAEWLAFSKQKKIGFR